MTKKKATMQIAVPYRGQSRKKTKAEKKRTKNEELTILGKAFRAMGGAMGSAVGGYIGHPLAGAAMGTNLGAAISRWLGAGDYTITANTVLGVGNIPMMHKDGQSVIVRHKEFVTELTGSQNFTVQKSIVLNPGLPSSFPWLARVAGAYQEYRIRGMVFHYVPSSGSSVGSTNTALGTVMFQTTYRASDSTPINKVELLNEYCSNEVVPSESLAHPIECDPKENPFNVQYIRAGSVPSGDSLLSYDLGVTHIATSGMQVDGKTVGDVWVTYEVELKKPQVTQNISLSNTAFLTSTPAAANSLLGGSGFYVQYTSDGPFSKSRFANSTNNTLVYTGATPGATYGFRLDITSNTSGTWSISNIAIASGATSLTLDSTWEPATYLVGALNALAATAWLNCTATSSTITLTLPTCSYPGTLQNVYLAAYRISQ